MAQQVKIAGALFDNVPSIRCPDVNDVYHPFVDPSITTATASDVAQGKQFIAADGTLTQGTASGGGGGASNVISGEFTTGSEEATETINLPYAGNGYPIIIALIAEDGVRGSEILSANRPLVGFFALKNYFDTAPDYTGSEGKANNAGTGCFYKSSSTVATSTTYRTNASVNVYSQSPTGINYGHVSISAADEFKVQVSTSTTYSLYPSTKYHYVIVYSE